MTYKTKHTQVSNSHETYYSQNRIDIKIRYGGHLPSLKYGRDERSIVPHESSLKSVRQNRTILDANASREIIKGDNLIKNDRDPIFLAQFIKKNE